MLKALRYYGGKHTCRPLGDWIAGHLPHKQQSIYAEPFAGMLGILLRRPAVRTEIVGDMDGRLINWWRCVRDKPKEMADRLEFTPARSRAEYERAATLVDDVNTPDIERAVAYHVLISQSMGAAAKHSGWSFTATTTPAPMRGPEVLALADRMRCVQIENKCATTILRKTAGREDAVIYVDPPYLSADTSRYQRSEYPQEEVAELLMAQQGVVAVSGYRDDGWDDLLKGWNSVEWQTFAWASTEKERTPRTEVLWLNKPCGSLGLWDIGAAAR